MNIRVQFEGASYEAEVARMIRLFAQHAVIVFDEGKTVEAIDIFLAINVEFVGSDVSATVTMLPSRDSFRKDLTAKSSSESDLRKTAKRAVMFALHVVLSKQFGFYQPWGILTGVHPTKLVHQHVREKGREVLLHEAQRLQEAYLIDPIRAKMLVEIANKELDVIPDLYQLQKEVSVYIGIPFCPTHCAYCTFPAYSMVDKARYAKPFLEAIVKEIQVLGAWLTEANLTVTSVYVGGGTPTSLMAKELRIVLEAAKNYLPNPDTWREFCVEAGRPDTITKDRLLVMKELGVDRISVNPQTFHDDTLHFIGRGHKASLLPSRIELCKEIGFHNINMDLILGLPGENLEHVIDSVTKTIALQPDSITVHTLSYKRSSTVSREKDRYAVADDATIRAMMAYADHAIRANGMEPYYLYRQKDILANLENVGYAHPNKEGIYNISIIEEAQTIIGIGGGSATKCVHPSTGMITTHTNPREPSVYVATIDQVLAKKIDMLRALYAVLV